jgi:myo-inositol-1-phosphate synthase
MIGAHGNVGTCVVAGAAGIARGLFDHTGLVTGAPEFDRLGLAPMGDLVFGGHEVRDGSFVHSAKDFGDRNGLLTPEIRRAVAKELRQADTEIRIGTARGMGSGVESTASDEALAAAPLAERRERIQDDLLDFKRRGKLDDVVVVNLASTEPTPADQSALASLAAFNDAVERDDGERVPCSVLYAMAAMESGFPFVDFTPACATGTPLLAEAALRHGVPFMGRDGKTGETLVKTVLAPMFVARNFRVLSWEGFNMLGNNDGAVLREPGSLASKVRDKDEALRSILGDDGVHSTVRIDYVPSLADWKQAYDFIHFQGFLGARMQMHFNWQGCDSALAAPLVLDLVRMADLAHRRGEAGPMRHLACFFKAPVQVPEQDFPSQMNRLYRYVAGVHAEASSPRATGS